jgi:hypothetical protein
MKRKNTKRKQCRKVGYKSPALARRALKDFGYARGSKRFYKCPHHDAEMYHLTSEGSR